MILQKKVATAKTLTCSMIGLAEGVCTMYRGTAEGKEVGWGREGAEGCWREVGEPECGVLTWR